MKLFAFYCQIGYIILFLLNTQILLSQAPIINCTDHSSIPLDDITDLDSDGNYCELLNDIVITNSATDPDANPGDSIKWQILIDYWGDGTVESEFSSFLPIDNPKYITPTLNDEEVTAPLQKELASASWARHVVKWKAFDNEGNVSQCTQIVEVSDKQGPVVDLIGCTTVSYPIGQDFVELSAKDFNAVSKDKCWDESELLYTFLDFAPNKNKLDQEHCFNASGEIHCSQYVNGFPIQKWNPITSSSTTRISGIFWCGENDLDISVWDPRLNSTVASTKLILSSSENLHCFDEPFLIGSIAGNVATETGSKVSDVTVNVKSNLHNVTWSHLTNIDGEYEFNNFYICVDHIVSAEKNDDPLNGVSTKDLLLIHKHITGLNKFNSYFKLQAADVNNDNKVNALDIMELRKLILGIYDKFPNNKSWKFLYPNPSPTNSPDQAFLEETGVRVDQFLAQRDFTAVKIGDVDETAVANFTTDIIENRSNEPLELILEYDGQSNLKIRAGNNFQDVHGFQFIAKISGAFNKVIPATLKIDESNFAINEDNTLAVSYSCPKLVEFKEGEHLFTLEGIKSLNLIKRQLRNEAYLSNKLELAGINFRNQRSSLGGNELFQNEPNPFNNSTSISFNQVEKGNGTLTIFDFSGEKVYAISTQFEQGLHTIKISKNVLSSSGLYFYTYQSDNYFSTKKMLLMK